jgi:hypothetical protein
MDAAADGDRQQTSGHWDHRSKPHDPAPERTMAFGLMYGDCGIVADTHLRQVRHLPFNPALIAYGAPVPAFGGVAIAMSKIW